MKEEWRQLNNHSNYLVSSFGRIKNIITNKIYSGQVNSRGYIRFDLCENGKRFVIHGHRAVAEAFIQNPYNKPIINHIDGDRTNNHISNLEWCTSKENSIHARDILHASFGNNRKKVMCIETGVIFSSCCEVEKIMNIHHVCDCANGKRLSAKGYHFKYI